jgi:chemotaxis protein CheX
MDLKKPFEQAVQSIFTEIGFEAIRIEESQKPAASAFLASLGLTGSVQGHIIFLANMPDALAFTESILKFYSMEDDEPGFSEMRKAILSEILNQLSGRLTMILDEIGVSSNITPPTILIGDDIVSDHTKMDYDFTLAISGSFGTLKASVSYKKA